MGPNSLVVVYVDPLWASRPRPYRSGYARKPGTARTGCAGDFAHPLKDEEMIEGLGFGV